MKKNLFVIRKMIIGLTLAASFIIISAPAFSKGNTPATTANASFQPSVKYVGADNSGSLFQVEFDNETPVKFELTVSDNNGTVLYNEAFQATSFSKYIKLLSEGDESNGHLNFSIRTADGTNYNYSVATVQETVKEVTITKSK